MTGKKTFKFSKKECYHHDLIETGLLNFARTYNRNNKDQKYSGSADFYDEVKNVLKCLDCGSVWTGRRLSKFIDSIQLEK